MLGHAMFCKKHELLVSLGGSLGTVCCPHFVVLLLEGLQYSIGPECESCVCSILDVLALVGCVHQAPLSVAVQWDSFSGETEVVVGGDSSPHGSRFPR